MVVETTGTEDKIDGLVQVLRSYGILEMVRTGRVAITRGTKDAATAAAADGAETMACRIQCERAETR